MRRIGFIGTGVMGSSIVKHLLKAGYEVNVYNRTKSKTDGLISLGATWYESPAAVTEKSEVVITIVGYPNDVEETYLGENGIFKTATSDHILIDMTTSTPTLAVKLYEEGRKRNIAVLDAPVSGGDLGAQKGALTVMVGGDEDVFNNIEPILNVFSSKVNLQGSAGKGQHTKMVNQIMVAGTMTGLTEMLVYAQAANLNLEKVIDTVSGGSANNWSLVNYGPRILSEDFSPGFFIKHFVKDLNIALNEAEKLAIDLPFTTLAQHLYEKLETDGHGNDGTQAFIKLWWAEGNR
ncbi:3-hydroxyisobutyrate dehydrogenase [Carnobacterium iners]|uniref:3-hydroxyisobutyrate dehydrogenase n=1 Tax=Carnobacterium iners TaxID=1073423 RepID=A0A1X7NP25_9LACT|nr:NAD(P)-dependent oxidoreductase [Carnobacterium iners]SEK29635.1 3-hydroxyisobutyrate dehydrogenase [Carnobacterium iners]SMH39719.1 3-hydroxyisobutyrate dehydrogenase [Carnobacterium iners]